jgi:GNAT superfamily N-acetyltransferase
MSAAKPMIRPHRNRDDPAILAAYQEAIDAGSSFPITGAVAVADARRVWVDDKAAVRIAELDGAFAGCYYVRANFTGRAGRIANAGYLVPESARGRGVGRALLEDSLGEAKRLGFEAMMFNLVFERNPARRLWEAAGFEVIGRIPRAIDSDQDALIYFREL